MKRKISWAAALLLSAMMAHAEEAVVSKETNSPEPATHAWLELQRSGEAASPQAQPLSGPVMDKVHERYLKSFEHQVPMYYQHDQPLSK